MLPALLSEPPDLHLAAQPTSLMTLKAGPAGRGFPKTGGADRPAPKWDIAHRRTSVGWAGACPRVWLSPRPGQWEGKGCSRPQSNKPPGFRPAKTSDYGRTWLAAARRPHN